MKAVKVVSLLIIGVMTSSCGNIAEAVFGGLVGSRTESRFGADQDADQDLGGGRVIGHQKVRDYQSEGGVRISR